jgi:hypothetical protein
VGLGLGLGLAVYTQCGHVQQSRGGCNSTVYSEKKEKYLIRKKTRKDQSERRHEKKEPSRPKDITIRTIRNKTIKRPDLTSKIKYPTTTLILTDSDPDLNHIPKPSPNSQPLIPTPTPTLTLTYRHFFFAVLRIRVFCSVCT